MTDPVLDDLDPAQREAVTAGPGPLLVAAGAGTGKTRVITRRVAWLIAQGEAPERMALLTFTQRAAREMIARIGALLDGPTAHAVWAGTFHAFCARLLRQHGAALGLRPDFGLLDPPGAMEVLGDVLAELPAGLRQALPPPARLLKVLSWSLNADRPLVDAVRRRAPRFVDLADELDAVCGAYATAKLARGLLDFDDLLVFAHLLLGERPDLRDALAHHLRHLLVDEYQDTNPVQAALVQTLGAGHRNVCVVGDDAQAIYGFRGADVGHILGFRAAWPDARLVRLERNHRSTPQVVAVANAAARRIGRRIDKTLRPVRAAGPRPVKVKLADVDEEARFVATRALELRQQGVPLAEQAVLYRAHAHARRLQFELTRQGVPFVVRGGPRVYAQAHVRDALAFVRVWAHPADVGAWRRVFRLADGVGAAGVERIVGGLFAHDDPWSVLAHDGVGPTLSSRLRQGYAHTRARLLHMAEVGGHAPAMLGRVLSGGYLEHLRRAFPDDHERRHADLKALMALAEARPDPLVLLEELTLLDVLTEGEAPDALVLSTIHQAKGLEWPTVFVLGLSEGRFPARLDGDLDEERRLFYVALTRAGRWLHLCSPARDGDGDLPRRVSRFVADLTETDPHLVETWHIAD